MCLARCCPYLQVIQAKTSVGHIPAIASTLGKKAVGCPFTLSIVLDLFLATKLAIRETRNCDEEAGVSYYGMSAIQNQTEQL